MHWCTYCKSSARSCVENPWLRYLLSFDQKLYQWISVNFSEYQWISVNIGEYQWISVNISEYQWNRFNSKVSGPTTAFWEDQLCRIYLYLYLYLYSIEYRIQQKPCSPRHTKYKTILPRQGEDSLFWPFKLHSCPGCQLSPCKWLGAVALNIQQDGHRVHTRIVTCRPSCWYITRWTLDTDR